jgi:hypothetical protein
MAGKSIYQHYLPEDLLGPVLLWTSRREQKRLAQGKTYEPKTFIEHRNWTTQTDS